jgi:hypothetical protein
MPDNASQNPPIRQNWKPWKAAGMSRATWYRYGKPAPGKVPAKVTMKQAARRMQSTLRTTERCMRVAKACGWYPEPYEMLMAKKITIGEADKMIREMERELSMAGIPRGEWGEAMARWRAENRLTQPS